MTERLPDRFRDRLYFGMARLRERMEIADAVNHGRAVSDPRLAAEAVALARKRQRPRIPLFVLGLAATVAVLVSGIVERRWLLTPFAPLFGVLLVRGLPLRQKTAIRAEQENRRLLA